MSSGKITKLAGIVGWLTGYVVSDQPRGLVVRASGYKSRGPGFDSRLYHGDFPCGGRIPVVTMVWVVSRIRFKVETSLTRSHTSINSWLNPRQRSPRWRGPHHERQPAHQLIEYPSTLIADYGREKKNVVSMHLVAYIVSYLCYPHPVTVVCDCTRHPGRVKTSSALVRDFWVRSGLASSERQ